MEPKVLKIASKIATPLSLSSLGILVLYLLFRTILQLPVFGQLAEGNTFLLLLAVVDKVFYLAMMSLVLGILAFAFVHWQNRRTSSRREVLRQAARSDTRINHRFTDAQFETYRDSWASLEELRTAGEALWTDATESNIEHFSRCLSRTRSIIGKAGFLFHSEDYAALRAVLKHFTTFGDGKRELAKYMRCNTPVPPEFDSIKTRIIASNRRHMSEYTQLLDRLRATYYNRLSN